MDVSNWAKTGYGENSTLEKFELLSPDNVPYIIKFARDFSSERTNWEDLNEVIAAKVASLLGLEAVEAQIAYYNNRRGCLMKHFGYTKNVDERQNVATLLEAEFGEKYNSVWKSDLSNTERLDELIYLFKRFSYFPNLKDYFVEMVLFDLLIGNQDRHGHNWQLLFKEDEIFPSPLYDNGASLGWQLDEEQIKNLLENPIAMTKFFTKTLSKAGLDNRETPKIKATSLLKILRIEFAEEVDQVKISLRNFDEDEFGRYCNELPYISELRKEFLVQFIIYRKEKILEYLK